LRSCYFCQVTQGISMIKSVFLSFIFFFVSTPVFSSEENFIVLDALTGKICKTIGIGAEERVSPCSTFKIPLSLMGFDSGVLEDGQSPTWSYQEGYSDFLESWKADQTPLSWMKLSCIWYSQVLTAKLGLEKIQQYLSHLLYGNQDMTGDEGKNNGLTRAWISSSLKISPQEQVLFLQKLVLGQLAISAHAIEMTKQILFMEEFNGWKLFGKTGWGSPNKEIGWFVGWIEKEGRCYTFAYNILAEKIDLPLRIPRTKQLLEEAGVL